jgi:HD superfamily phosphohydrolase
MPVKAKVEKRRLIKDPVWGNLEVFSWENKLINHFLFNRLHNIVQNSSAYKVYPGLKYSRLLHSVGVSHVVTQLFLNAAAKARGDAQDFFENQNEGGKKRISAHDALKAESKIIESFFTPEARLEIARAVSQSFPCSQEDAVTLAAIRIAALVHDIGHLPFSHVFENAIDGFLKAELGDAIVLSDIAKTKRDELNLRLSKHEHGDSEGTKLHEVLGKFFLEVLQTSFHDDLIPFNLLKGALLILEGKKLPICKGFVAGPVDADRIDFVRRDGFFSGLFNSSMDFGRLAAFFELAETKENNLQVWKPRPSPRTISETEKLLLERFWDYKYVVVHHRVHLYDEIMENVLVRLMADGSLNDFLETLCKLLDSADKKNLKLDQQMQRVILLRSLLTAFDDPWLEIRIRNQYVKLQEIGDGVTKLLLQAYVEDRHCFKSAFKTDEDFLRLCGEYAPALLKQNPSQVRNALGASKYVLQKELGDVLDRTVLIGSTDKKLNFGIRNDSEAEFVNVTDLFDFLIQKKIHSFTFNFWYEDTENAGDDSGAHEKIVAQALHYIQEIVTKQLQLTIHEGLVNR